jgi:hypothetical protein
MDDRTREGEAVPRDEPTFTLLTLLLIATAHAPGQAAAANPFFAADPSPAAYVAWCVA